MSSESYGTMDRMIVTDSEGASKCTGDGFSCLLRFDGTAQDYFLHRDHDAVTIQVGDKVVSIDHTDGNECVVRVWRRGGTGDIAEVRNAVRFPVDWSAVKVERVLP